MNFWNLLYVSSSSLIDHGMFSFLDCLKYGAVNIASCVAWDEKNNSVSKLANLFLYVSHRSAYVEHLKDKQNHK